MEKIRANKQIWRLAEWLANDLCWEYDSFHRVNEPFVDFKDYHVSNREFFYDKAVELLRKMTDRNFTGGDNHE